MDFLIKKKLKLIYNKKCLLFLFADVYKILNNIQQQNNNSDVNKQESNNTSNNSNTPGKRNSAVPNSIKLDSKSQKQAKPNKSGGCC